MVTVPITMGAPTGWRRWTDPDHGVLLQARAPVAGADGVYPVVALLVEPLDTDRRSWPEGRLAERFGKLPDAVLEDAHAEVVAGRLVDVRRFGYRTYDGTDLVCSCWSWLVGRRGFILACTLSRRDHHELIGLFRALAETFDPGNER